MLYIAVNLYCIQLLSNIAKFYLYVNFYKSIGLQNFILVAMRVL